MIFKRANKKTPCPICGKPDYCGVAETGEFAICMRVSSASQAKNGGYIHRLIDTPLPAKIKIPMLATPNLAPVKRSNAYLDAVYSAFLAECVLSKDHHELLQARGLTLIDRQLHGYVSMPTQGRANYICRTLAKKFDLRNVPGFYRVHATGTWHFINYRNATGFLIPIRDEKLKICGLQLRRDDDAKPKYMIVSSQYHTDGASSGAPPHFAFAGMTGTLADVKKVIVTEGPLKANIIFEKTGTPTIGLIGVSCFDYAFGDRLVAAFPNLRRVDIAFDMDAKDNAAVKAQRDRLVMTLRKINLDVRIQLWNPEFKGFDDFLTAQSPAAYVR